MLKRFCKLGRKNTSRRASERSNRRGSLLVHDRATDQATFRQSFCMVTLFGRALIRPRHALALVALLAVSACAGAPVPTAALDRARTAVRAAEADPAVDRYARPELE